MSARLRITDTGRFSGKGRIIGGQTGGSDVAAFAQSLHLGVLGNIAVDKDAADGSGAVTHQNGLDETVGGFKRYHGTSAG